ncbi:uncharacterized protein HemY [Kushneria sinocarnis]|uniref:Uncharacterized protein HemY n=1 Tax=Kushneria sinocarnis TaxID=595502 RepID=A0A420WYW6_9GAMM|nr:tetratricopeptide repeat protein [Kushneria sinocarnis]RKR06331.1 uncharacterized protein HemY [Kushneria sinocarnis]
MVTEPGRRFRIAVGTALRWLSCSSAVLVLMMGLVLPAHADGPALPQATVNQLQQLQQQLSAGNTGQVLREGQARAERLDDSGADGWARALYLQLAASAARREGNPAQAAELLSQARSMEVAPYARRLEWLQQEAALRARADQLDEASRLYHRWAGQASLPTGALWSAAQVDAERGAWQAAGEWIDQARRDSASLSPEQRQLAATVYQHTGNSGAAVAMIEAQLDEQDADPEDWRRAAALYQRSGQPGRAAAIWEAGWQRGILQGRDDLMQRIRLHMAGGTPARAGELLDAALSNEQLKDTVEHRRLLAQAWTRARVRDRALEAWQRLAERTGEAADWRQLGELAYGWGHWQRAIEALEQALQQGAEQPGRLWLLRGVAAHELGEDDQARRAFRQAAQQGDSADQARAWLQALEGAGGASHSGKKRDKPAAAPG